MTTTRDLLHPQLHALDLRSRPLLVLVYREPLSPAQLAEMARVIGEYAEAVNVHPGPTFLTLPEGCRIEALDEGAIRELKQRCEQALRAIVEPRRTT